MKMPCPLMGQGSAVPRELYNQIPWFLRFAFLLLLVADIFGDHFRIQTDRIDTITPRPEMIAPVPRFRM